MAAGATIPLMGTDSAIISTVAAATGDGNKFENDDGKSRLIILNPTASSYSLTVSVPAEADTEFADGNVIADVVIGAETDLYRSVKRLPPSIYKQRSGDNVGFIHVVFGGTITGVVCFIARP